MIEIADGKGDNALAAARDFTADNPGPAAVLLLAETFIRLKRTSDATAVLEKSLTSTPNSLVALRLAEIAKSSGDAKKSETVLSSWVAKNPTDQDMRRAYATSLLETGDVQGARREFEALLKQRPEDPIGLNNLGWLLQKDDPARALSMVSLAARIAPRSPEIADTLGWMKYQRREYQDALPLLQRAHDLDVDNAWITYHLALALDATGKRPQAKTLLASALAKNPKFDEVDAARKLLASW
jgi:Flp pilus assembly protein TadD